MVVKGVSRRRRRIFQTWREKAVPCTVFEIASTFSYQDDTGPKLLEYATIGVKEYFVFDPEGEYLEPVLVGYRLQDSEYVQLEPAADGSLLSRELGLRLRPEGPMLRLLDAKTGEPIPTREERAAALAEENERLRAELARLQAAQKPQRRGKRKS
jgi:hypothetical protein